MMCNDVKLDLEAYVQNKLPQLRAEKIRRHLAACPGCTLHYRDLKEKIAWLALQREQEPAPMPDYLEQNLRNRRTISPRTKKTRWLPLVSVAASLALVIFSISLLGGGIPLSTDRVGNQHTPGWGIINLPVRGDMEFAPPNSGEAGDFDSAAPVSGGQRGADSFNLRVQANIILEHGSDVPYQLRYEVAIRAQEFTSVTLVVNKEKLDRYFSDLAIQTPFQSQYAQLKLTLPIADSTLPVNQSNHELQRTLREFFEGIYLVLQSDTDTLVYQIPVDSIYFTNNTR